MRKLCLLAIVALCSIASKAQVCDLTCIFHLGKEPKAATITLCEDDTKDTFWLGHAKDTFEFDDDGNLKAHNGKEYSDAVRDDDGMLKEITLDGFKFTFDIKPAKIVICQYRKRDDEFWHKTEYFLNKDGYVAKKVKTWYDGSTITTTYSYIEKSGGNWYIRKVKETNKEGTTKCYQCLKGYGI